MKAAAARGAILPAWRDASKEAQSVPLIVSSRHATPPMLDRRRPWSLRIREALLWLAVLLLLAAGLLALANTSSSAWRTIAQPTQPDTVLASSAPATAAAPPPTNFTIDPTVIPDPCGGQSNDDLLVVVKTGSSVIYERALVHLETTLKCIPHTLLVSDVDVDVGNFHFVDVLKELDPKVLRLSDFEYYHRQKSAFQNNDEELIREATENHQAWDLDKWKFIPMMYRAWLARNTATKWFVFVEADSLIDWANLNMLLRNQSSSDVHFYGAPVFINDTPFAHGGSGFALSHAAMEKSVGQDPKAFLATWGGSAKFHCCGDFLLAMALRSFGVELTGAYPLFQGDPIHTAPILPDLWCRPVVSMHHVTQRQVATYWTLAGQVGRQLSAGTRQSSVLWREMYRYFIQPKLKTYRLGWDNLSDDWEFSKDKHSDDPDEAEYDAIASPAGCERRCRKEHDCMQWSHHNLTCKMGRKVRGGQPSAPRKPNHLDEKWISGWMLDRIEAYEREHPTCPDGIDWTFT